MNTTRQLPARIETAWIDVDENDPVEDIVKRANQQHPDLTVTIGGYLPINGSWDITIVATSHAGVEAWERFTRATPSLDCEESCEWIGDPCSVCKGSGERDKLEWAGGRYFTGNHTVIVGKETCPLCEGTGVNQ